MLGMQLVALVLQTISGVKMPLESKRRRPSLLHSGALATHRLWIAAVLSFFFRLFLLPSIFVWKRTFSLSSLSSREIA